MASMYLIWLLASPQAFKSVLPVTDSFSNQEMRTFSRIRTHQSTVETINTSLWRRKTKPSFLNYFAVVVLPTNKTCSASPWRVSVFSVLWNNMVQNWLFITVSKRTCVIFHPIFLHFFRYVGWLEADIVTSNDNVSHLIYRAFRWYLTFFCYCTVG